MNKQDIVVICDDSEQASIAEAFASTHKLACVSSSYEPQLDREGEGLSSVLALVYKKNGVVLRNLSDMAMGDVSVDFVEGKLGFRRRQQSFQSDLAKAVGVQSKIKPKVWDLTAGFGADGFGLACLGCSVKFIERNPVVYCLLESGLAKAKNYAVLHDDAELVEILSRIELTNAESKDSLRLLSAEKPDVICIDPMFPERSKSAKVKKGMQVFHQLVGADGDSSELLELALRAAVYRVVVKRPLHAELLSMHRPNHQIKGKTIRFDVYTLKSLKDWRES
ncbi:class I SAM-dependent methyltransferase [Aurantivibrio infirmus]